MRPDQFKALMVATLKKHLASGKPVILPAGGQLLWQWFTDLCSGRSLHAGGPNPISLGDIDAYCRISRWPMQPHHVAILQAMDRAYIEHAYAGQQRTPDGVKTLPPRSEHAMTAGMFDAMFGGK